MIKLSQPTIPEPAIERVGEILRSGQLVQGEECIAFECELAEYLNVDHALLVSSGTAALHLSLLALGVGPGDAVLVPDFTFAATANVVEMTGASAVIVDVEPGSYNMCPELLERTIENWSFSEPIKAILPVLEFGNPKNSHRYRDIAEIHNLALIEDAACAIGAEENGRKVGTFGGFGCFSFHPRKVLTTGEGGLVTTQDSSLAEKVALLRNHGMRRTEQGMQFETPGLNYRLTDFQAAIGRSLLGRLPDWIEQRRRLAESYHSLLAPLEEKGYLQRPEIIDGHSCQTYMVKLATGVNRDRTIHRLRGLGVEANLGAQSLCALKLYRHPANENISAQNGSALYSRGLALPLHEHLAFEQIELVVELLNSVIEDNGGDF